jgi:hypothetical protein
MTENKKTKTRGAYSSTGKVCVDCFKELNTNNTRVADIKQANYICISCRKARDKQKYIDKKEILREQQRLYDLKNKITVIMAYGGKCECCNENKSEFLMINCKNNTIGSGGKLYRWLIKNNFPQEECQLLCYNCNYAKNFFGYCPHNCNEPTKYEVIESD